METINFSIDIKAPAGKIWETLWNAKTYAQWTAGFGEGSKVETDWQPGSKVLFLGSDSEGMVSRIASIVPNHSVSFEHLAAYKNGVEDAEAEEIKDWVGAHENYELRENGSQTELLINQEVPASFKNDFQAFWETALVKIKELAETKSTI